MNNRLRKIYKSSKIVRIVLYIPKYFVGLYRKLFFNDEDFVRYQYKRVFDKKLNIEKPRTFSEKIQWLKLYDKNPLYTICADKYRNREFVAERIGSDYLIPLIFSTNNPFEIPFDNLPDEYIIKTNHTSGYNMIVKNNKVYYFSKIEPFDHKKIKRILKSWLKKDFFYLNREWEYKEIKPMIVIEKLLHDESGNTVLNDYKIHCFNGEPKFIQTIFDRMEDVKENWYDTSWNSMDIYYFSPNRKDISKPDNLNELLSVAKKLSKGFNYVRTDLYSLNGKIFFGELTFHPYSGLMKFQPTEWDLKLGNLLTLPVDEQ